jgi:hypothetical protein
MPPNLSQFTDTRAPWVERSHLPLPSLPYSACIHPHALHDDSRASSMFTDTRAPWALPLPSLPYSARIHPHALHDNSRASSMSTDTRAPWALPLLPPRSSARIHPRALRDDSRASSRAYRSLAMELIFLCRYFGQAHEQSLYSSVWLRK